MSRLGSIPPGAVPKGALRIDGSRHAAEAVKQAATLSCTSRSGSRA